MRKLILLTIFVLLLPFTSAGVDHLNLRTGDSTDHHGWKVEIVNIFADRSALIKIYLEPEGNGEVFVEKLYYQIGRTFDGIYVEIADGFYDYDVESRWLTLYTETAWHNMCNEQIDCNDGNECTINKCEGYPLNCTSTTIEICETGDGCCAELCNWYSDQDCEQFTCDEASDCRDWNDSTKDTCEDYACVFTPITWCETGDTVCPNNCTYTFKLSENRDNDCSKNNKCIEHSDCDDDNKYTTDICFSEISTNQKSCIYVENEYKEAPKDIEEKPNLALRSISTKNSIQITNDEPEKSKIIVLAILNIIFIYILFVLFKFKPDTEKYITHSNKI